MKSVAVELTENGLLPDLVVRNGIRRLLEQRLNEINACSVEDSFTGQMALIEKMRTAPIAVQPMKANQQHYELPVEFYEKVLGEHLKYSCAYWPTGTTSLNDAEQRALELVDNRAGLQDGMDILELGCGWGAMTFWMARKYSNSRITAISNSRIQARYIRSRCELEGITNVSVIRVDINDFKTDKRYDRVISLEMFEHMRNWSELFCRIDQWLVPEGELFMHIFTHRTTPYLFVDKDSDDWMSRHFFTGGMMPSADLPLFFQADLKLLERWSLNGSHYQKTSNAWLANMDEHREELMPVMEEAYGRDLSRVWWMRWRMFFMACAELFAYRQGEEWFVSHYRFAKQEK